MSYIKIRTLNESLDIIGAIVQECAALGGPTSRKLKALYDLGDFQGIIDYQFDYDDVLLSIDDAIYSRQIQGLFSKQDFIDLGVDKEAVAYTSFVASEEKCRETNRRFRTRVPANAGVDQVLYLAQRKIARILGDLPLISDLHFAFGPGTNTSTRMGEANSRIKLSSSLECSAGFLPFAEEFLKEFPEWLSFHRPLVVKEAPGKLTFVPKSCKTYRSIIIEPILNGLYQKGIGKMIRDRLRLHGLDLRDQEPNRLAAERGSVSGEIATIDLSSASDTISYGLVLELLPPCWFQFLEIARSGTVDYKGRLFDLQKFSSMGNAYTFELESLIFYSLSLAVCEHLHLSSKLVRSYGDDIIIPVAAVPLLRSVIDYCGFSINIEKSYWSGPFRESCGSDYFFGVDIRPFYLKEKISERVLYLMHNWFIRHCEFNLAGVVYRYVNHRTELFGPDGYGDGHLIGNHVLRRSKKNLKRGYCGGSFDTYTLTPKYNRKMYPGDYVYPAYSIYVKYSDEYDEDYGKELIYAESVVTDPDTIRGYTGYKKISIYTLATAIFSRVSQ